MPKTWSCILGIVPFLYFANVNKFPEVAFGDVLRGTLIVLVPTRNGVLVSADKLAHSTINAHVEQSNSKIVKAGRNCIVAATHAKIVQGIRADGVRDTLFDALLETKKFIDNQNHNLVQEFPADVAFRLAQTLVERYDAAINQLPNKEQLLKSVGSNRPLFYVKILNRNQKSRLFEIVAIDVYRAGVNKRFDISKHPLETADAWGMPEEIDRYRKTKENSDIAKSLEIPCPCWQWKEQKARELAIQMNEITHLKFPHEVGKDLDFLFIDNQGNVSAR